MNFFNKIIITSIIFLGSVLQVHAGGVIPGNQTAYIDNPMFISAGSQNVNFAPTNAMPSADLSASGLTGQVWSAGLGWIQFSGSNYAVDVNCNASTQTGTLSGLAWGSTAGWINFSPTNGGVTIDANGVLDGSAWIQNAGWMVFDKSAGAGNPGYVQFDFKCTETTSSSTTRSIGESIRFICKDPDALNYSSSFGRHNGSLCEYDEVTQKTIQQINKETTATDSISTVDDQVCNVPFDTYHKKGSYNPEIKRIQNFLNQYLALSLIIDGINGGNTTEAIKDFQEKYRKEILDPWNLENATGFWYQSTRYKANKILGCPEIPLTLDNGYFLSH